MPIHHTPESLADLSPAHKQSSAVETYQRGTAEAENTASLAAASGHLPGGTIGAAGAAGAAVSAGGAGAAGAAGGAGAAGTAGTAGGQAAASADAIAVSPTHTLCQSSVDCRANAAIQQPISAPSADHPNHRSISAPLTCDQSGGHDPSAAGPSSHKPSSESRGGDAKLSPALGLIPPAQAGSVEMERGTEEGVGDAGAGFVIPELGCRQLTRADSLEMKLGAAAAQRRPRTMRPRRPRTPEIADAASLDEQVGPSPPPPFIRIKI